MKLIDVGMNLMNPSYDRDRDEVVKAAAVAGVSPLVVTIFVKSKISKGVETHTMVSLPPPGSVSVIVGIAPTLNLIESISAMSV